jgi:hypothetical protein
MSQPWKMIVYIAADNSLYQDAMVNLRQITVSSLSSDVEILVQFDGPTADLASRYRCADGRKTLYWQAPEGYTCDRRKRLEDFLSDSVRPSGEKKRIFLVLYGHGGGLDHVYVYKKSPKPVSKEGHGQAPSLLSNAIVDAKPQLVTMNPGKTLVADVLNAANANLYVKDIDLSHILQDFKKQSGQKIDILGLDACLMGMAEICHELRESVALMVASDEDLPKGSWPYDLILSDLTKFPGMDAGTLSTLVISRFLERYIQAATDARFSLSSFDLAACDKFADKFKRLVDAMTGALDQDATRGQIVRARSFSRTADESAYVDVAVFCKELTESFPASSPIHKCAREVLNVIARTPYIIYHRDFGEDGAINYSGLALYFPESLAAEEADARQEPVQPAILGSSSPGKKSPPYRGTKTPPYPGSKNVVFPDGVSREITSYRILWEDYINLSFNTLTGWPSLLEKFLPAIPHKGVASGNNAAPIVQKQKMQPNNRDGPC